MNRTIKSLEMALQALDFKIDQCHANRDDVISKSDPNNLKVMTEKLRETCLAYQDISDLLVHYKQIVSR